MLIDRYQRKINYLRISVTDRCNLRCIYCMPQCGVLHKDAGEILTFEEIVKIARLSINLGVNKIKITGGEPLVRRRLPRLLYLLSSLAGLNEISLTTNGVLLHRYAPELREAGLKKINISIDTLDEQKFKRITRFGELKDVLRGIDAALESGFFVKLNVVIMRGLNDDEILNFARFAQERKIIIRFIELMPIIEADHFIGSLYLPCSEVKETLSTLGNLEAISLRDAGNGPAQYYKIKNTSLIAGFINPISCKFCSSCNRLRLTANGWLMPCLAGGYGVDLKKPLRDNREEKVLALIKKAASLKPSGHTFIQPLCAKDNPAVSSKREYLMSQIGG